MPWKEVSPMDERRSFINEIMRISLPFREHCRRFCISPKTGYKWLNRFKKHGLNGFHELPRKPLRCPHKTPENIENDIIAIRIKHKTWGPKKILAILRRKDKTISLPAPSTVSLILKRHHLVEPKRRATKRPHPGQPLYTAGNPNDLWCVDFKGQFKTQDGNYCYPLTVTDSYSRYIICCKGLKSVQTIPSWRVFERIFYEYGIPYRIRSDNGVPFATKAIGRLSRLSIWWIKIGIIPELIEPAKPQQNSRHERMHRVLKEETTRPPAPTLLSQQYRFDEFIREYNQDRPHEALGMQSPAAVYHPSLRPMPRKLPPIEYPLHFEVRKVSANGGFRWGHRFVPIGQTLVNEYIGLEEIDTGYWDVYFSSLKLGVLIENIGKIEDKRGNLTRQTVRQDLLPMYLE